MKPTVYIDGKEGTTGLQIYDRLAGRDDLELLLIEEEKRKDTAERKKLLNQADIAILCLPDAAAVEAVALIENPNTRVIDASTAHRTADGWDYGFPELSSRHRQAVEQSSRLANPGCHASGFIACVYPLVSRGLIPASYPLTCFSLTGYSGGGKKMIAQYEAPDREELLSSPRIYGLTLRHKHLPEMQKICGLEIPPVFCPIVADYYKGMATTITLHSALLPGRPGAADILEALTEHYAGQKLVKVAEGLGNDGPMLAGGAMAGRDSMVLTVCGHEDQVTVTALFDNLGKGASGAAVENLNLMLGMDEATGLLA